MLMFAVQFTFSSVPVTQFSYYLFTFGKLSDCLKVFNSMDLLSVNDPLVYQSAYQFSIQRILSLTMCYNPTQVLKWLCSVEPELINNNVIFMILIYSQQVDQ